MNPIDKAIELITSAEEIQAIDPAGKAASKMLTEALEALRGMQSVDVDALRDDALSDVSFKATSDMVMEDVGFGAMAMFDHLAAQGYLTRVADETNDGVAQGGHEDAEKWKFVIDKCERLINACNDLRVSRGVIEQHLDDLKTYAVNKRKALGGE